MSRWRRTKTGAERRKLRTRPRLAAVAVLAAVALLASACGDSDSSADPVEETTTTAAEQPEETLELEVEPDDTVEETGGTAQEAGPEFIELPYWEAVLAEGLSFTQQDADECDDSDPGLLVCSYELTFNSVGTHIGGAFDSQTGTITTYLAEVCEGPDGAVGNPVVRFGEGSILTEVGDELHFVNLQEFCNAGGPRQGDLQVTGGTGRFEDASGRMFGLSGLELGVVNISTGTLTVRADLWADTMSLTD